MNCFICQTSESTDGTTGYRRCTNCGHEVRKSDQTQTYMVNEALSLDRVSKMDLRDRFQVSLARRASPEKNMIWDVGSGSGRFLFHVKKYFKDHAGIEITPECVQFSREKLGLQIESGVERLNSTPSLVTMWHSLEHLPIEVIAVVLADLRKKISPNGRVLISVPNGSSSHFKLFGRSSVYYDLPNHIHQFSTTSLEKLMSTYKFVPQSYNASFMYAFFGSLLSFLNLLSPRHNFLYEEVRRKPGWSFKKITAVGFYGLLSLVVWPISAISYGLTLLNPHRGSVITVVFKPV